MLFYVEFEIIKIHKKHKVGTLLQVNQTYESARTMSVKILTKAG